MEEPLLPNNGDVTGRRWPEGPNKGDHDLPSYILNQDISGSDFWEANELQEPMVDPKYDTYRFVCAHLYSRQDKAIIAF
jgi:hypothetical protein